MGKSMVVGHAQEQSITQLRSLLDDIESWVEAVLFWHQNRHPHGEIISQELTNALRRLGEAQHVAARLRFVSVCD